MARSNACALQSKDQSSSTSNIRSINQIKKQKIWKTLRRHILIRRETIKQAEDLKKKKFNELKRQKENKLILDQINQRLSLLQRKREALEEEKRELEEERRELEEERDRFMRQQPRKPVVNFEFNAPDNEAKCKRFNRKLLTTININKSAVLDASSVHKQKNITDLLTPLFSVKSINKLSLFAAHFLAISTKIIGLFKNVEARNQIEKIRSYNPNPFNCISNKNILYICQLVSQLLMMIVVEQSYISLEWPIPKQNKSYVVCKATNALFKENATKTII